MHNDEYNCGIWAFVSNQEKTKEFNFEYLLGNRRAARLSHPLVVTPQECMPRDIAISA